MCEGICLCKYKLEAKKNRLKELRDKIKEYKVQIGKHDYAHNIISLTLRAISKEFCYHEANKTVKMLKLDKLGWQEEEPEPEPIKNKVS